MLQPLSEKDFPALFDFEQRNREYFIHFIPDRPELYRQYKSFVKAQSGLLQEQLSGSAAFFIIYNGDQIVCRMNLSEINASSQSAEVGYRSCQSVAGQGITSSALHELVEKARAMGISVLNACVSDNNSASERVLAKAEFCYQRSEADMLYLNNCMLSFRYYQRRL